ncbi:MAG: flagellar assembly peptidoglycan hydrolase FlgJ [Candidatus Thiodiazotropha sp.]
MNSMTSVYNDFSGLAELKYQAREDQAGASAKVAKQFESLFMQMMVKQMRQAGLGGGILDSDRTRFYQEMYDQQLSLHLAEQGGMGLSQVLRRQLGVEAEKPDVTLAGLEPYWRSPVRGHTQAPMQRLPESAGVESVTKVPEAQAESEIGSPEAFVRRLWDSAEAAAAELGIPAEALLAQAALETGWGNHVMARTDGRCSHNLFGIKADQRWQGGQVRRETLEYESGVAVRKRERFRTYESFDHSFQDYVDFMKSSPRYAEALRRCARRWRHSRRLPNGRYIKG